MTERFVLPSQPIRGDYLFHAYDIACPKCGAHPFRPFMYGQVQRSLGWGDFVRWVLGRKPYGRATLICWDCKEIVGHE